MKLAKYWTRESGEATGADGQLIRVVSRGWSNESLEAAGQLARDTARRLAEALVSGGIERSQYLYGQRPLPEPVLQEFSSGGGDPAAVVTRNSYGALVLNVRDLMFVDIDREEASAPGAAVDLITSVLSLFGKAAAAPKAPADPVLDGIQRVAERNGLAVRVYKTAAGYRAIVTNAHFEAAGRQSEALLQEFGADPLYVKMCRMQESFRARLTPKPWRCRLGLPPVSFPFLTPQEESRFAAWEANYSSTASRYATCRYLTTFGGVRIGPGFEDLIAYHDQKTNTGASLPLA
ncbi:MAG: hypothetical protein HYR60_27000 [Acidobacteria bacterium]|nr:hypothetical protein [Acidobacteriota bacterium]